MLEERGVRYPALLIRSQTEVRATVRLAYDVGYRCPYAGSLISAMHNFVERLSDNDGSMFIYFAPYDKLIGTIGHPYPSNDIIRMNSLAHLRDYLTRAARTPNA